MKRPSRCTAAASALLALSAATSVTALSDEQIASVFGRSATNLTGSSAVFPEFTYSVVTNSTHALCSLNATSTAPSSVGWMATALGTAMANGDFLITWPTVSANSVQWTLSHRRTTGGEAMPQLISATGPTSTDALFTLVPALSTTDASSAFAVVSYVRELQFPSSLSPSSQFQAITKGTNDIMHASCSANPGSTDPGATIQQHDQSHTATQLDLSPVITLSTSTSPSSGGTQTGSGGTGSTGSGGGLGTASTKTAFTKREKILIAHATLGSTALLVLAPIAIFIARYLRNSTWFPAHAGLQVLAAMLVVATFATGYTQQIGDHFVDTHTRLGLVILIVVILQVLLGSLAHRFPHDRAAHASSVLPTLAGDHPVRLAHIVVGIAVVVLGFINVKEGFEEWDEYTSSGHTVPKAVKIVFWIWLAVVAVVYVAGWALEAAGKRRRRSAYGLGAEKVGSSERQY